MQNKTVCATRFEAVVIIAALTWYEIELETAIGAIDVTGDPFLTNNLLHCFEQVENARLLKERIMQQFKISNNQL